MSIFFENIGALVYGSWFDHVLPWYLKAQENPKRVLFITYEQLKCDLHGSIAQLTRFLNRPLDSNMVDKIANHCSFMKMKDNDQVNRVNVPITGFFDQSKVKFMRKGVIGDWQSHFTEQQSMEFDALYEQRTNGTGLKMAFTMAQGIEMYGKNMPAIEPEDKQ